MRILGFSEKWDKLSQLGFTTFRFPRKDRDWEQGELVQIVYKPRTPQREILGTARIINKEPRNMVKLLADERNIPTITEADAKADGFQSYWEMWHWLFDTYRGGQRFIDEPMNKLTLVWVERRS